MTESKRRRMPPEDGPADDQPASAWTGTVGLALALVLVSLALIVPGGAIGSDLRRLLGYLLGWGSYVLPVVLAAFTVAGFRARLSTSYELPIAERLGWGLILLCILQILQAVDGDPLPLWGQMRGGGWLGRLGWSALQTAFGEPAAQIVIALATLIAVALLLDLTIEDLWTGSRTTVRVLGHLLDQAVTSAVQRLRTIRTPARGGSLSPTIGSPGLPFGIPTGERRATGAVPAVRPDRRAPEWQLPPISLLRSGSAGELSQTDITKKIKVIEQTLADFDVFARVVQVNPGPTVTQFGLEPGFRERRDRTGAVVKREKIKVSEITALVNDLALALAAPSIRIEAPVPGQQVVGLEVPNGQATLVSLRQIVESSAFQKLRAKTRLALALGEDVSGQPVAADLAKMPHLLIAGATGSGKSIFMNGIISCLLLQATPAEVRLILIDPKRVEMTAYNDVPHLLRPVVVDVDKVVSVLKWVVHEMDERYKLFESHGVRNIEGFNKLAATRAQLTPLPFIVVIIDELADLMMLAPDDTERLLCRLAQLARATGIHLVVATQRPSVDVITGLIKANFPTRVSFAVTSQIDSRTILDTVGAEKLLGRGDMLFLPTDAAKPIRLQGVFVSDEEIEALVNHWKSFGPPSYVDQLVNAPSLDEDDVGDELYEKAVEVAREHTRISTSLLQRRLRIGYTRAARLIDLLEQNGVVGPAEGGGRSREVHHDTTVLSPE